jgi:ATP-dependent DNA helicase RecG
LKVSNTNKLSWDSSITLLSSNPKKPTKTIIKLLDSQYHSIKDILWILPLRVIKLPSIDKFSIMEAGKYFKGRARLINIDLSPAFGKKGKQKVQLFNATVVIKDTLSDNFMTLKWFNAYPNIKNQLESLEVFEFLGIVQDYKGILQIINPILDPKDEENSLLTEYPTVSGVSGAHIKKLVRKIPFVLWEQELTFFSKNLSSELKLSSLNKVFRTLHGIDSHSESEEMNGYRSELVYIEFLKDQLKVVARKIAFKKMIAPRIEIKNDLINKFISRFPYELTDDQCLVNKQLFQDLSSGHPMMRIIQGDVGCGKTTVALISTYAVALNGGQIAMMCPTEALAYQHYKSFKKIFADEFSIDLLVGSLKAKEKNSVLAKLTSGQTQIIVGTHSLFQKTVIFKNLQFVIIDEQHKFGVEQRLKLITKGVGVHCLLMSATPIPRTLQLAQYGDLDISTIKTLPAGRKGTQTRIISNDTYEKYLSFIKTRVEIGEQVYIVVPTITESESLDLKNVEGLVQTYKVIFPQLSIACLHGQLKTEEKKSTMEKFEQKNIDILISTSVIEVGIDVLNSTVMAIYNPDRFGLSSLHQLRGRVGRGKKPGFCFLIPDKKISQHALSRLKLLERSNDGFEIAEADLKNRGEGDLFGTDQSGNTSSNKFASIFEHFSIFEKVQEDIRRILKEKPELFNPLIDQLILDKKISTTV